MKRLAIGKLSSLLRTFTNYHCKMICNIGSRKGFFEHLKSPKYLIWLCSPVVFKNLYKNLNFFVKQVIRVCFKCSQHSLISTDTHICHDFHCSRLVSSYYGKSLKLKEVFFSIYIKLYVYIYIYIYIYIYSGEIKPMDDSYLYIVH
jgi:hypothetical protein